jgi:ribosome assembly protein YihI (activator of Der GTPase)
MPLSNDLTQALDEALDALLEAEDAGDTLGAARHRHAAAQIAAAIGRNDLGPGAA